MKILLAYDRWSGFSRHEDVPEDFGAEFDDEKTIQALVQAMRAGGHDAGRLPVDEDFCQRLRESRPDMVFNIAEGTRGPSRESLVPAWLDHAGIPYTGSDGLVLGCTLDKALAKTLVRADGVRTVPFQRVSDPEELNVDRLQFPVFVKPNGEGSSMGIRENSLVESAAELRKRVEWVLRDYQQDCLVEEFAPGREFCVGLLGNEDPEVLPVVEVRSASSFYSYEHKSRHEKELICPADIPEDMKDEMRRMALMTYRSLRCRDLARVDLKLDRNGRPSFLEINPLPGLSPDYSIYPHQGRTAGYSYEQMISRIIESARNRHEDTIERMTT